MPFDGGRIGVGELEGRVRTLADAEAAAADDVSAGIRRDLVGLGLPALVKSLDSTVPAGPEDYLPPPAPCG